MAKTYDFAIGGPDHDWPTWIPIVSFAIAGVAVAAALVQRMAAGFPLWGPLIFAAIAVLPFLLDVVDLVAPFRTSLPLRIFPIPVLVGGAYLVQHPAEVDFAPFIMLFMTAEVISRSADDRPLAVAVTVAPMGVMIGVDLFGGYDDSFVWIIGIAFAAFGGYLIQALSRRTIELNAAQADLAERSATEERQRIAREVHDVIAHSLSVTMLHVTAARMALERGSQRAPEALEALREAEQQGRKSLGDIRRTVGLLGAGEGAEQAPMPSVSDLPKLVTDFRAAGLDVTLSMDGDVAELPAPTGLNLYRIVQESLTNVAKHAPGATARVELHVDDDIRLRVHNTATNGSSAKPGPGGGLGMRGMIERATALGGRLAADDSDDGWTVFLYAPLPASEPATD